MSLLVRLDTTELHQLDALARTLASVVESPCVLYLEGPLGAGKTTFVRALARALGYGGVVKSPTYGLLELYEFEGIRLLHLDLYRIESAEELEFISLRDLFDDDSILLIEWPGRGEAAIPTADLEFTFCDKGGFRAVEIRPGTEKGRLFISGISNSFQNLNLDEASM